MIHYRVLRILSLFQTLFTERMSPPETFCLPFSIWNYIHALKRFLLLPDAMLYADHNTSDQPGPDSDSRDGSMDASVYMASGITSPNCIRTALSISNRLLSSATLPTRERKAFLSSVVICSARIVDGEK